MGFQFHNGFHKQHKALLTFIFSFIYRIHFRGRRINHDILTNSLKKDLVFENVVVNALVVENVVVDALVVETLWETLLE